MEIEKCAKCGKELKDYEINYRLSEGKTVKVCRVCAMAIDYKKSMDEKETPAPAADGTKPDKTKPAEEKPAEEKPQSPKKLTQADIDLILTPSGSSKSGGSVLGMFESNNNVASVMKIASVLIIVIGVIASVIFMVSSMKNAVMLSVICLVSGIIFSLIFLALSEIISLLAGINGKMR